MNFIPYARQSISTADIDAVAQALRGEYLTTGPTVELFERELCRVTGASHAVACSSGTAALHLASMALGVSQGDLGVTSALTFVASANCLEYCGGEVEIVDIDTESLCISPLEIEKLCEAGRVPKVVVAVSYSGNPAPLPELKVLADRFGFHVIEDAAHSLGSRYLHQDAWYSSAGCAHTDLSILSFHPVKTITTLEGGAVLTNSFELAQRLYRLRSHGIERDQHQMTVFDGPWYYEMQQLGYHYRISDVQCALGISQLARLADFKRERQKIASHYRELLGACDQIDLPKERPTHDVCPHLFPIQLREGPRRRHDLYQYLKGVGVGTQVHYIPVHYHPYYRTKYGFKDGKCPAAEQFYERCLSLPLYAGLTNTEFEYVIKQIKLGLERAVS